MRRLGTGTGFAVAKLSEVLPLRERSLASVRMTEKRFGTGTGFAGAKHVRGRCGFASFARYGQDDGKARMAEILKDDAKRNSMLAVMRARSSAR